MATITSGPLGTVPARAAIPWKTTRVYTLRKVLNFNLTNAAANDVIQALAVPANTHVIHVISKVTTAEGGTATTDIGDGTDPNGWNDAVDLNSTGFELPIESTDPYADDNDPTGKVYTSADTIDLTLDHALDACIVEISALCVDLNG